MRGGIMGAVKFAGIYSCIFVVGFGGGIFAAWVAATIWVAYSDGWAYIFGNSALANAGYLFSLLFLGVLTFIQAIKD